MGRDGLVVLGAGGHAKVVIATAQAAGLRVRRVLDDNPALWGRQILGVTIDGPMELLATGGERAVVAVGDNRTRARIVRRLDRFVSLWVTLVHPQAIVHPSARLGEGTVVFAGAVIQPDVVIGEHAIVNTAASVDHDCAVGPLVHLAPGVHLAGGVRVGEGAMLGIGSSVVPGMSIGAWATVGAGAVVIRPVDAYATVAGVPARLLRKEASVHAAP